MIEEESLKRVAAAETRGKPRPKPVAPISLGHHAVSNQDGYFSRHSFGSFSFASTLKYQSYIFGR